MKKNMKSIGLLIATLVAAPCLGNAEGLKSHGQPPRKATPVTRTVLEAEMKDHVGGAEAEAVYSKRTKGEDSVERFGARFEIVDPNSLNVDENSTLELHVDGNRACTFRTPGQLETEVENGRPTQVVEFRAGILISTVGGVTTKREIGNCNGLVPAVQAGSKADLFLEGSLTPLLTGTFADD